MKRWICAVLAAMTMLAVRGLADEAFASLFGEAVTPHEATYFECADPETLDKFWRSGTGILLFGAPEDGWSVEAVHAVARMCDALGAGGIRFVETAEIGADVARTLLDYLTRQGTSFANVTGSAALIDAINASGDPAALSGLIAFVNKGMLIGVHVGTDTQATAAESEWNEEEVLDTLGYHFKKLGSSPCPSHC